MDMRDLYHVRSGLPGCMEWHGVGGITPHLSPYGSQAPQDRRFPDDHVPLPGFGGDFYEDYYGAV